MLRRARKRIPPYATSPVRGLISSEGAAFEVEAEVEEEVEAGGMPNVRSSPLRDPPRKPEVLGDGRGLAEVSPVVGGTRRGALWKYLIATFILVSGPKRKRTPRMVLTSFQQLSVPPQRA